jgi:hypothetical protein
MYKPMDKSTQKPVELIPDGKVHIVTVKIQRDIYEWLVNQAHERRASLSYVIRDLLYQSKTAQQAKKDIDYG